MNRKQLEEKIQTEAKKHYGHALSRNALKQGITAFASLFGPAEQSLEVLGKFF